MSKLEIFVLGLRISNFEILGLRISNFTKTQIFTKITKFYKNHQILSKKFLISQILWVLGYFDGLIDGQNISDNTEKNEKTSSENPSPFQVPTEQLVDIDAVLRIFN